MNPPSSLSLWAAGLAIAALTWFLTQMGEWKGRDWTVMVYMNATADIDPFAISDFRELSSVGSSDRVDVVVQLSRGPGATNRYGSWSGTYRYHVGRGTQPDSASRIADLGNVDMTAGGELRKFVVWAESTYPAKHYFLLMWGHRGGWYPASLATSVPYVFRSPVVALPAKSRDHRFDLGRGYPAAHLYFGDWGAGRHLYVREIADALNSLPSKRNIDVLGFDSCLMAMMENAYAFRRVADFYVASEDDEGNEGWEHSRWLRPLVTMPDMTPRGLGRLLVDAFADAYTDNKELTLSATQLDQMTKLNRAIDVLAMALIADMAVEATAIEHARNECYSYPPGDSGRHGIDLAYFCSQLIACVKSPVVHAAATEVRSLLTVGHALIGNTAGEYRQDASKYGSHGLAIYFPSSGGQFVLDPNGAAYLKSNRLYQVEFVRDSQWPNFLLEYFKAVP
jgi:cysteine peptidase C11 family protein